MVKNPRKLDGEEIKAVSLSVDLCITPLSTATMTLKDGEKIAPRTYIELFNENGSLGIFRSRSPMMGTMQPSSTPLDHAIAEVGDSIVNATIDEESTVGEALGDIWDYYKGSRWQLGSIASSTTAVTLSADYDTVLDAILDILEQVPSLMLAFDFSTSPWTVNVVQREATVTAEGRLSRNVKSATITEDDSELCTRLYMENLPGTTSSVYGHMDADTISTYGIVEKELSGAENATQATRLATTYLEKHKRPIYSVEIEAVDLSRITGESLDSFALGRKYRLALPSKGVTVEETITNIRYSNVFANPKAISITLSEEADQVINYIKKNAKSSRSNGKKIVKNDKEYKTIFDQTDTYIDLWAGVTATNGSILRQAGLHLDADGVLVYATDNEKNIGSKLNVQADKIGMVVGTIDGQNYIKAGEIALSINQTTGESTALINASHVNISATSDVHTLAGDIEHDADGKLIIKNAGGMYVQKTEQGVTSLFGVWDKGNLTGGVMAQQINGQTETLLLGDHVNISGTSTVQTLAGVMERDANGNLIIKDGAGFKLRYTEQGQTSEMGVYTNKTLTAGIVISKINGDSTTAAIKADKIYIEGTTTLSGQVGIQDGSLLVKTALAVSGTTNGTVTINNGSINAKTHQVNSGGKLVFAGSQTGEHYDLDATSIQDVAMIKDVAVVNNTLRIWKFGDPKASPSITFSKAVTSLNKSWSNGHLEVTPQPQGSPKLHQYIIDSATKENSDGTQYTSGDTWYVPVNVKNSPNEQGSGTATGLRIAVNASARYSAGQNSVNIVKGNWSNARVAFTKSAGTASTKAVKLGSTSTNWSNGSKTYTIKDYEYNSSGDDTGYSITVTAPSVVVSFDCTGQGDPSYDSSDPDKYNDKPLTAKAVNGTAELGTNDLTIHMTQGSWSNGRKAVNTRMTNDSGKLITRIWVAMPTTASWSWSYPTNTTIQASITVGGKTYTSTHSI